MSVSKIELTCTKCGATLETTQDREFFFCQYCGEKIIVSDPNNRKFTYRTIYEARIREAEARQEIRVKELEAELLKAKRKDKAKIAWYITLVVIFVCFFIYQYFHSKMFFGR